jgi:two-component system response regulator YesN
LKILIVDDEALARELLEDSLKKLNLNDIYFAKNGFEAFDIIQKIEPEIVLADIRMPGMDGIELLSKVRKAYAEITFIFISGYDLFEYAQKAVSLGAFNYLLKPYGETELKNVMDSAVERVGHQKRQKESEVLLKVRMNPALIEPKIEQDIATNIEKCDKEGTIKLIAELYNSYWCIEIIDKASLMNLNFQLIILIYKISARQGANCEDILGDEFILYSEVNSCESVGSTVKWFDEKLDRVFNVVNTIREKGNRRHLERAREFIQANITSDIALETVAEHVHLNPSYLSRAFKQEFGENFVDYLIKCRVNKAKELLKKDVCKVNEVCKLTGFNDIKHFYKVFKKYTGFTPTEYRDI